MMTDDWIQWSFTEDKPFPLTLDSYIHVKFRNGKDDSSTEPWTVKDWYSGCFFRNKGHPFDIVAYKRARPE